MTATDELRKLLDERGVEWEGTPGITFWGNCSALDVTTNENEKVSLHMCCTPEQAIAATLGIHERTCEMYRDEHGIWHCAACERGADVITGNDGELDSWIDSWAPNYCPYCGRRGE